MSEVRHAKLVLGMLEKTFVSRDTDIWKLHVSLVRPHLEYAAQACCPYLVIYIKALEKVQKRVSTFQKICKS